MKKKNLDPSADHVRELLENYLKGGHRKPKTRREFLASGLISVSSAMAFPTLIQLISQSAWGAECASSLSTGQMPAFINIQLAGGPALFANYLATGAGGAKNLNYANMGMTANPTTQNFFANSAPFWLESDGVTGSQMIRGLLARAQGDTSLLSNSAFVAVAAKSVDDTSANKTVVTGMLEKIGLVGSHLPYLITGDIFAGFASPAVLPAANQLAVASVSNLQASLGFQGALTTFSSDVATNLTIQRRLVASVEKLSKYQIESIIANPNSDESVATYKDLMSCAVSKNTEIVNNASNVNIYDATYPGGTAHAGIWALDQSAAFNPVVERTGQAVVNCLRGLSGATTISLGGYDYHLGATRATANEKDRELGDLLGRILRSAKVANRKTFIYITADGSLVSTDTGNPNANWAGDFGERGMHYIIAYDPAKAPTTRGLTLGSYSDANFQLNHFLSNGNSVSDGVVATVNPIGASDAQPLCASAVFLNYLSFAGITSKIDAPELGSVKSLLTGSLPSGGKDIFNYYLRITG